MNDIYSQHACSHDAADDEWATRVFRCRLEGLDTHSQPRTLGNCEQYPIGPPDSSRYWVVDQVQSMCWFLLLSSASSPGCSCCGPLVAVLLVYIIITGSRSTTNLTDIIASFYLAKLAFLSRLDSLLDLSMEGNATTLLLLSVVIVPFEPAMGIHIGPGTSRSIWLLSFIA